MEVDELFTKLGLDKKEYEALREEMKDLSIIEVSALREACNGASDVLLGLYPRTSIGIRQMRFMLTLIDSLSKLNPDEADRILHSAKSSGVV